MNALNIFLYLSIIYLLIIIRIISTIMIVSIIIKYKLPMTYIVDEIIKNAM
jgi:hypothetical protein